MLVERMFVNLKCGISSNRLSCNLLKYYVSELVEAEAGLGIILSNPATNHLPTPIPPQRHRIVVKTNFWFVTTYLDKCSSIFI